MLKIGKKAPLFKLVDQYDAQHSIKQYAGNFVILYFYPKDDTPGCAKEACAISEVFKDFKRMGVTVLGVSKDSVKSHKKFAEKYNLPFTLLSDPTMEMMEKYGAVITKQKGDTVTKGTLRISYLIDREGKVAKVYPAVDPANHALELIADLKSIFKEEKKVAKLAAAL